MRAAVFTGRESMAVEDKEVPIPRSVYLCCKYLGPHIIKAHKSSKLNGKVVMIGSVGSYLEFRLPAVIVLLRVGLCSLLRRWPLNGLSIVLM